MKLRTHSLLLAILVAVGVTSAFAPDAIAKVSLGGDSSGEVSGGGGGGIVGGNGGIGGTGTGNKIKTGLGNANTNGAGMSAHVFKNCESDTLCSQLLKLSAEERDQVLEAMIPKPDPDTLPTVGVGCLGVDKPEPSSYTKGEIKKWLDSNSCGSHTGGATVVSEDNSVQGAIPCSLLLGLNPKGSNAQAATSVGFQPPGSGSAETLANDMYTRPAAVDRLNLVKQHIDPNVNLTGAPSGDSTAFRQWVLSLAELNHRSLTFETRLNYEKKRVTGAGAVESKGGLVCIQRGGEGVGVVPGAPNAKGDFCGNYCQLDIADTEDKWVVTVKKPMSGGESCKHENAWFRGQYVVAKYYFWLGLMRDFEKFGMIQLTDFDGVKPCGPAAVDVMRLSKKLELTMYLYSLVYAQNHQSESNAWIEAISKCGDPAAMSAPGFDANLCTLGLVQYRLKDMWSKLLKCEVAARVQKDFYMYDPAKTVTAWFNRDEIHDEIESKLDGADDKDAATKTLNDIYRLLVAEGIDVQTLSGKNHSKNFLSDAAMRGGSVISDGVAQNLSAGACGVAMGNVLKSEQQYRKYASTDGKETWTSAGRDAKYAETLRYHTFTPEKTKQLILDPVRAIPPADLQKLLNGTQSAVEHKNEIERVLASLNALPFFGFAVGRLKRSRKGWLKSKRWNAVAGVFAAAVISLLGSGCGDKAVSSACDVHISGERFACERQCPCNHAPHNLAAEADDDTCPMLNLIGAGDGAFGGGGALDAGKDLSNFLSQMPTGGGVTVGGTQPEEDKGLDGDLDGDGDVDDQDRLLGGGSAEAGLADGNNGLVSNRGSVRSPATGGGSAAGVAGRAAGAGLGGGATTMASQSGLLGGDGLGGAGADKGVVAGQGGGFYQGNTGPGFESGAAGNIGGGAGGMNSGTGEMSVDGAAVQAMDQYLEKTKSTSLFDIVSRRYDQWGKSISPH